MTSKRSNPFTSQGLYPRPMGLAFALLAFGWGLPPSEAFAGTLQKMLECTNESGYNLTVYSHFEAEIGIPDDQQTRYVAEVRTPDEGPLNFQALETVTRIAGQREFSGENFRLTIRENSTRDSEGREPALLKINLPTGKPIETPIDCADE